MSAERPAAYVDLHGVPLTPEDETMMLLTGFAVRDPDGVLRITEKGSVWVQEWCRRKREEATR